VNVVPLSFPQNEYLFRVPREWSEMKLALGMDSAKATVDVHVIWRTYVSRV